MNDMRTNALSVANYFIDLANRDGKEIGLLGLMLRVYITHGFSLALYNKGLLDPQYDTVEAWNFGPCIPSVYYSFVNSGRKNFGARPIKAKEVMLKLDEKQQTTPVLENKETKKAAETIWRQYIEPRKTL